MYFNTDFQGVKEKDLQTLFYRHPYLIDPSFENYIPRQFYKLPSGFLDLIIFQEQFIVAIELKIEFLSKSHVLQLAEYVNDLKKLFPSKQVRPFLIGRTPKEDLNNLITTFPFSIQIKILNQDVPIKIKFCANCRLANSIKNSRCWKCETSKWM